MISEGLTAISSAKQSIADTIVWLAIAIELIVNHGHDIKKDGTVYANP
jgi:hypothetical protein